MYSYNRSRLPATSPPRPVSRLDCSPPMMEIASPMLLPFSATSPRSR